MYRKSNRTSFRYVTQNPVLQPVKCRVSYNNINNSTFFQIDFMMCAISGAWHEHFARYYLGDGDLRQNVTFIKTMLSNKKFVIDPRSTLKIKNFIQKVKTTRHYLISDDLVDNSDNWSCNSVGYFVHGVVSNNFVLHFENGFELHGKPYTHISCQKQYVCNNNNLVKNVVSDMKSWTKYIEVEIDTINTSFINYVHSM